MLDEIVNPRKVKKRKLVSIDPKMDRGAFWRYCVRAQFGARQRSKEKGVPVTIDKHFIDRLFIDQNWRCAVSGIPFTAPAVGRGEWRKNPFGPSLDRKVPALGYVPGNIRLVCNIVNAAMNEWGEEALLILLNAMATRAISKC
jgi:hypothetical protein